MFFNSVKGGFIHGSHSWTISFFTKAIEINGNWNRSDVRSEIEEKEFGYSEPFSDLRKNIKYKYNF